MAGQAAAQDAGTQLVFGLSSTLRADDNWALEDPTSGRSFEVTNALSFGITSATRTSSVSFNIGGNLDSQDIAGVGASSGFYDPYASASFSRSGANSELTFDASIDQTDLATSRLNFDAGGGDKRNTSIGGRFEFGQDAALGGSFGIRHETDDYIGNSDPLNYDDKTLKMDAALNIAASSKLRFKPSISRVDHNVDDPTDTRTVTTVAGLTATAAVSEVLEISARASKEIIDTTVLGITSSNSSPSWGLSADVLGQSGNQSFDISQTLSNDGVRTEFFYNRAFETATFNGNAGIGLSQTAGGGNEVTASLDLVQPMRSGEAAVSLSRKVVTTSSGDEEVDASLDSSIRFDLAGGAGFTLALDLGQSFGTGAGAAGSDGTFSASYNRPITDDWALVAGYQHRYDDDGAGSTARSNSVFVTMSRNWVSQR